MQHAHLEAGAAAAHMDRIYRHQRFIYDLTRKYYLLGRDRMIAGLAVPDGASVLEVGCGTGRNLIEAARRYPHARFHGFDISAQPHRGGAQISACAVPRFRYLGATS